MHICSLMQRMPNPKLSHKQPHRITNVISSFFRHKLLRYDLFNDLRGGGLGMRTVRQKLSAALVSVITGWAALGLSQGAEAAVIPYPNVGIEAPEASFTAAATGDIVAYFAGTTAGYTVDLGLRIRA